MVLALRTAPSGRRPATSAGLLETVIDRVFGFFEPPDPLGETWQEAVRTWAEAYRTLAHRDAGLVLRIVTDRCTVALAAPYVVEPLYAALRDAGLPPGGIVRVADTLVDCVHGFALVEAGGAH